MMKPVGCTDSTHPSSSLVTSPLVLWVESLAVIEQFEGNLGVALLNAQVCLQEQIGGL